MMLPVRLHLEVVNDLSQAADWYNNQCPKLGNEFLDAAYRAFDLLASRPKSFPIVHKHVRRALMRRFPYAIYFKIEHESIMVLVVIHTARSPQGWKQRLR